jgi:hypothetical protein
MYAKLIIYICLIAQSATVSIHRLSTKEMPKKLKLSRSSGGITGGVGEHQYFFNKIPILSHEMSLHTITYKPRTFSITSRKLSEKKILVEFNYTNPDVYTKYSIRMRYHNHLEEYMTNKTLIDKNEPNQIILHDFPKTQYILCVTLYPSMFVSNYHYPPLSTSDMCIDILFGESHPINSHSKTGLLMPLLLSIVIIQLISLPVLSKMKCDRLNNNKKRKNSSGSSEKVTIVNDDNKSLNYSLASQNSSRNSTIIEDEDLSKLLNLRKNDHELKHFNDTRKLGVFLHYDNPDYQDLYNDEMINYELNSYSLSDYDYSTDNEDRLSQRSSPAMSDRSSNVSTISDKLKIFN